MTNYYISIPLAAQRRHDMLAEAEAEAEAARGRPDRRKSSRETARAIGADRLRREPGS